MVLKISGFPDELPPPKYAVVMLFLAMAEKNTKSLARFNPLVLSTQFAPPTSKV